MPARPTEDALVTYWDATKAWCWSSRLTFDVFWMLGFVRELRLKFKRFDGAYARPPQRIDDEMATDVTRLFRTRAGSRIEVVHVPSAPTSDAQIRLLAALPQTCGRVVVDGDPDHIERLLPQLPAQVLALELRYADHESLAVQAILRASATMRVHVPTIEPALLADPRVEPVNDYGFVDTTTKRVRTTRPNVFRIQGRFGVAPVRAQLARITPEPCEGLDLDLRRTDRQWLLRHDGRRTTSIGDRRLQQDEHVELHDGDVVRQNGVEEVFFTHDILARARAL
ncbi:MAG: hypothetical protein QM831_01665 [Kofleriaceae bacterium]